MMGERCGSALKRDPGSAVPNRLIWRANFLFCWGPVDANRWVPACQQSLAKSAVSASSWGGPDWTPIHRPDRVRSPSAHRLEEALRDSPLEGVGRDEDRLGRRGRPGARGTSHGRHRQFKFSPNSRVCRRRFHVPSSRTTSSAAMSGEVRCRMLNLRCPGRLSQRRLSPPPWLAA